MASRGESRNSDSETGSEPNMMGECHSVVRIVLPIKGQKSMARAMDKVAVNTPVRSCVARGMVRIFVLPCVWG